MPASPNAYLVRSSCCSKASASLGCAASSVSFPDTALIPSGPAARPSMAASCPPIPGTLQTHANAASGSLLAPQAIGLCRRATPAMWHQPFGFLAKRLTGLRTPPALRWWPARCRALNGTPGLCGRSRIDREWAANAPIGRAHWRCGRRAQTLQTRCGAGPSRRNCLNFSRNLRSLGAATAMQ